MDAVTANIVEMVASAIVGELVGALLKMFAPSEDKQIVTDMIKTCIRVGDNYFACDTENKNCYHSRISGTFLKSIHQNRLLTEDDLCIMLPQVRREHIHLLHTSIDDALSNNYYYILLKNMLPSMQNVNYEKMISYYANITDADFRKHLKTKLEYLPRHFSNGLSCDEQIRTIIDQARNSC